MVRLGKRLKPASLKERILEDLVMRRVKRWSVHLSAKHLHGPKKIAYAPDELVVVCLVRDGRPYIKSFIDHYLSLGAKHIVFLDNGSSDGTVDVAREHERVTLIRSTLPFKKYEFAMKEYLISRFGKGRWSLYVDVDELFDYPYSDVVSLSSLLRYLNERSYTAVAAQMLDMFSDRAMRSRISQEDEVLKELYRFYDLSNIKNNHYNSSNNVVANESIKKYRDGIRKDLFDVPFVLTKHPLMYFDGEAKHKNNDNGLHGIRNARIADFSCVLYHYKLVDGFRERAVQAAREENYALATLHYKKYQEVLERNPDIKVWRDTAQELGSVNELIVNGFLVVSEEYWKWADAEKRARAAWS